MTFGNINEFAGWLATAGAFGVALSLIAEWFPGWETLNSRVKFFLTLLLALALAFASFGLINWVPAGVKDGLEPIFQVIMTAITVFLASQGAHFVARRAALVPLDVEFEVVDDEADEGESEVVFTPADAKPAKSEG